ncbi:hypothetical protein RUND412_001442 [Rhizina undulata]
MASTEDTEPIILADSDPEEDSDYGSGFESDTTSLISSAKNHVYENGRRYHGYKEGKYHIPNDESEQDRLDILHHVCLMANHGRLFISPVGEDWKPQRVLDIGTGSGIWSMDFADQYPSAEVIGVDLSPIQPTWVPPNLKFEVDDIEEEWSYADGTFDLIFIRHMAGFIDDWPKLYRQAFRCLKPGGWIELHDFRDFFNSDDGSMPPDCNVLDWEKSWEKATNDCGREWQKVAPAMEAALNEVGCVDVGLIVKKLPIGRWPKQKRQKEIGMFWRQQCLDGIDGVSLALFTRILGWDMEKFDTYMEDVHADLANPNYHMYSKFWCAWGRKPLSS